MSMQCPIELSAHKVHVNVFCMILIKENMDTNVPKHKSQNIEKGCAM